MGGTLPLLAMLGAIFFWSSSIVGNKILVTHLPFGEAGLGRFVIAIVTIWSVIALTGRLHKLRSTGWRPLVMGIFEPGLVTLFFLLGQSRTSAVNAASFWALMPILMPILGRFVLGEPLRLIHMVSATIAVGGVALLLDGQSRHGGGDLLGDGLCVIGVLCGCANQLIARRVAQKGGSDPLVTTGMQVFTSTLLMIAVVLVTEGAPRQIFSASSDVLLVVLYLGIFASLGPFILYNYALRHLPVARISLFPPLVSPVGAGLAALFVGEVISLRDGAAIVIILSAVFLPNILGLLRRRLPG